MDKLDIDKIEKIISDRKKAYKYFGDSSKVFNSFLEMEQNNLCRRQSAKKTQRINRHGNIHPCQLRIVHGMAYPEKP